MMSNEDLIRQLRTASIQADDMRLKDFGYLFKCAADAIEHKWIPVTERFPNKEDDVLFCIEWTGLSGTVYREIHLLCYKGLPCDYKPLYWMPLPELPKGEDE